MFVLPRKHISISRCLIGSGAEILKLLDSPENVSSIWYRSKDKVKTFESFVLTMDFLFAINAIRMDNGFIKKNYVSNSGKV